MSNYRSALTVLPIPTIIPQQPRTVSSRSVPSASISSTPSSDMRTENRSVSPNTRRTHAHTMTDIANATLPSIVLDEFADHRRFPIRFPTMDASASPTPSARIPVYIRIRDGLPSPLSVRPSNDHTTQVLTLQATPSLHTPSTDKSGSESPSHDPCGPGTRSRTDVQRHRTDKWQSSAHIPQK